MGNKESKVKKEREKGIKKKSGKLQENSEVSLHSLLII